MFRLLGTSQGLALEKNRFDFTLEIQQVEDLHNIGETGKIINYLVSTCYFLNGESLYNPIKN